jgi:hypothetical protein
MTKMPRIVWPRRLLYLPPLVGLVSACAIFAPTGGLPREPFDDIPVPAAFIPFSNDWSLIRSGRVTAARLVYQTELSVEEAATALETSLRDQGWQLKGREPLTRNGFSGQALAFVKATDTCRAELVPSPTTTRVDLIVARLGDAR